MRVTRPARPKLSRYLVAVGLVVVLAGLLFGYDQGVISGALDGIDKTFHPSTVVTEIITSWVTLGAMVGALLAGELAERLGRRMTILLAAVIFVVGALLEALAPDIAVLVAGRLVLGAGVGVASVAAPLYGAENAPARVRGRFVSLYQMAITIGIFFAYFADYCCWTRARTAGVSCSASRPSRPCSCSSPCGRSATPPVGTSGSAGRQEAEAVIRRVDPAADVDAEVAAIQVAITTETQATWGEVFTKEWRRPLVVASVLAVLQQLTGINAIIYYADTIFAAAGFNDPTSQSLATLWAVGGVNVVATLIAVFWVDRFGRKPLLLIGTSGMLFGLLTVAGAFFELNSVTASAGGAPGIEPGGHPRPRGPGGVHRLLRLLARTGRVDGHQRGLPGPPARSRRGPGHRHQLAGRLGGGADLPLAGQRHHDGGHVPALRRLLRRDLRLRALVRARDQGQDARRGAGDVGRPRGARAGHLHLGLTRPSPQMKSDPPSTLIEAPVT